MMSTLPVPRARGKNEPARTPVVAPIVERMRSMELELSTSMRSTWVWAVDAEHARELLALLGKGAHPATGRNAEDRVIDIDIGVVAHYALEALLRAGYTFRWSPQQHELNREADFYGVAVAGSSV